MQHCEATTAGQPWRCLLIALFLASRRGRTWLHFPLQSLILFNWIIPAMHFLRLVLLAASLAADQVVASRVNCDGVQVVVGLLKVVKQADRFCSSFLKVGKVRNKIGLLWSISILTAFIASHIDYSLEDNSDGSTASISQQENRRAVLTE